MCTEHTKPYQTSTPHRRLVSRQHKDLKPLKDVKQNVLRHVRAALRHGATVALVMIAAAASKTQASGPCVVRATGNQASRNRSGSSPLVGSGPFPAPGERSMSASHRRNIMTTRFDPDEFTATDLRIVLKSFSRINLRGDTGHRPVRRTGGISRIQRWCTNRCT